MPEQILGPQKEYLGLKDKAHLEIWIAAQANGRSPGQRPVQMGRVLLELHLRAMWTRQQEA